MKSLAGERLASQKSKLSGRKYSSGYINKIPLRLIRNSIVGWDAIPASLPSNSHFKTQTLKPVVPKLCRGRRKLKPRILKVVRCQLCWDYIPAYVRIRPVLSDRKFLMISRLAGILLEKSPPQILIDCNGVGYEIDVPMSTFYNLPAQGEKVVLHTHLAIREDAHVLFGFGSQEERTTFKQLIKISGVGARTALSILSGMSVADLAQAITLQEAGRLIKVPGIGKKTAERLLLELKGKLGANLDARNSAPETSGDILNALISLGYSDKEALMAVKLLPNDCGVSEGIKLALKSLSK